MKTELNRMGRIRLFPLLFQNGCFQSSRFLPKARRIVGSGDENGCWLSFYFSSFSHKSPSGLYSACVTNACVRNLQKLSSWKATSSHSMISSAMKSLTNEHTVRGRPTLQVVKRFRKRLVCKAYEWSTIFERTFWVNLSRIMLCQRS